MVMSHQILIAEIKFIVCEEVSEEQTTLENKEQKLENLFNYRTTLEIVFITFTGKINSD